MSIAANEKIATHATNDAAPLATMRSAELLTANFAALNKVDARFHLLDQDPTLDDTFEPETARSGTPTFPRDGRYLTSRYDPEREAADEMRRVLERHGETPDLLVVFGIAGGYLVREALATGCKTVHCVEPDPAVLWTTLSMVDLTEPIVAKKLRIVVDPEDLYLDLKYRSRMRPDLEFTAAPGYRKPYAALIEKVHQRIATLIRNTDILAQTSLIKNKDWFSYSVENFDVFAAHPGVEVLRQEFIGVPWVVVAAGPSLDKNVRELARYRDRVAIISVGTALRKLVQHDIVPDIVVALESNDIRSQFDGIDGLDRTFAALDLQCHPALWHYPFKGIFGFSGAASSNLWFIRALQRVRSLIPAGGSVATASFSLTSIIGADPIILVGQDLAYSRDGAMHAAGIGSMGAEDIDPNSEDWDPQSAELRQKGFHWIEGYNGDQVLTQTNLRNYQIWYEQSVPVIKALGRRAVNCTEGGARIRGFEQMPLAECLAELPTLEIDVRGRLEKLHAPTPIDAAKIRDSLKQHRHETLRLRRLLSDAMPLLEKGLEECASLRKPGPASHRAIVKAEKTDKKVQPLLESLDELLSPICNMGLFLTEQIFDYDGLSDGEQLRLNLQQTIHVYKTLLDGSSELLQAMDRMAQSRSLAE